MSLAKIVTVCAALAAGGWTLAPESASAGGWQYRSYRPSYGYSGYGYSGRGYGYQPFGSYSSRFGGYPSYGYGRSWYHDTSHYDYHPGYVVPHGDHYDYIPGHYHHHQSGHWHHR